MTPIVEQKMLYVMICFEQGIVNLGMAENTLCEDVIMSKVGYSNITFCYFPYHGIE